MAPAKEGTSTVNSPPSKRQRLEGSSIRQVKSADDDQGSDAPGLPEAGSWPSRSDSQQNEINSKLDKPTATIIPIAPNIKVYLADGGTKKFRPRLEWFSPTTRRKRARSEQQPPRQGQPVARRPPRPPPQLNNGLLPDEAFADFLVASLAEPIDAAEAPSAPQASTTDYSTGQTAEEKHTFGKDYDSALHYAIRENSTDAALELIRMGAPIGTENAKRVTPLILASQKGLDEVVLALIEKGANPLAITITGSTALLQASHFGRCNIVQVLLQHGAMMEMANYKNTTPLMRASQEGKTDVVQLLLKHGARVNRRNNEHMSALMLASQRGHADIVRLLLNHQADIDAMTAQKSTSLMLACKRENVDVVRVLVTAGCELQIKDTRGRTAKDVAQRKNCIAVLGLLEPAKQVELMQCKARVERNHFMAKMWNLLQQDRATVQLLLAYDDRTTVSIHELAGNEENVLSGRSKSDEALVRTMALPAPMVELIASYMPLPHLWDQRLMIISKRCGVDADSAVDCALDLIDEALEAGGFLEACEMAKVTPPTHFDSWDEWRLWGVKHNHLDTAPAARGRINSLTASLPGLPRVSGAERAAPVPMNTRDLRRGICYLCILAHRSPMLQRVLVQPPFKMPTWVLDQLITVNDIQSLSRRMGSKGAHFEATVAIELVMLASSVVAWYNGERSHL